LKLVRENIRFERGISKEKLEVGTYYLIQKWMNEMDIYGKILDNFQIYTEDYIVISSLKHLLSDGFPEYIKFYCSGNFDVDATELPSLIGCPEIVNGYFSCQQNNIKNLKGFPKRVTKDVYFQGNSESFTVDEISRICDVGGKIWADDTPEEEWN